MAPGSPTAATAEVKRLRDRLESQGLLVRPQDLASDTTGIPDLDALLGGWPRPGVVEITGAPGTGRLGLLRAAWEPRIRRSSHVAVVDALERFHPPGIFPPGIFPPGIFPPGFPASGTREDLLVIRPGPDRAAWAAEQIAASGAVCSVVLLDPVETGRAGHRLRRAVERGGGRLFVVTDRTEPRLPADVRLRVMGAGERGITVRVERHRWGRPGGEGVVAVRAAAGGPPER